MANDEISRTEDGRTEDGRAQELPEAGAPTEVDPIDRIRRGTPQDRNRSRKPARHVTTPEEEVAEEHTKKRKGMGLTTRIFIALGLGLLCGVIFHYFVPAGVVRDQVFVEGIFYVVGQGFLRLMQMLAVPPAFCSIVCAPPPSAIPRRWEPSASRRLRSTW